MENNAHKEIKVYGTLLNQTINTNPNGTNSDLVDNAHTDYLAVAYQLYDARFEPKKGSGTNFAVLATDRYQDIINKRIEAIYFDKTDDLDANDNPKEGITYIDSDLNVSGDTNIEGDTTIEGDLTVNGVINYNFNVDKDLAELGDVTLSSNLENKILRHGVGGDWVDGTLEDILPSASQGQVLKYNGAKWVAGADETGGGGVSLNQPLSAINTSNLGAPSSANNILMWNGSTWVYTTIDAISFVDSDIDNTSRTLKQWITYLNNQISSSNLWQIDSNDNTKIIAKNSKAAVAAGFYDSTMS